MNFIQPTFKTEDRFVYNCFTDNEDELNSAKELTADKQTEDDSKPLEVDLETVMNIERIPGEVSLINQASSAPLLLDDLLGQWITKGTPGEDRREATNRIRQFAANERIKILDLSQLGLKTLPEIFTKTEKCFINRMVCLNLMYNQLKNIPSEFGNLKNLKRLDLRENPLIKIPVEVISYVKETNSSKRLTLLADQIDIMEVSNDRLGKYTWHFSHDFFYIKPPMYVFRSNVYFNYSNGTDEKKIYYDTASAELISKILPILDELAKDAHHRTECFNDLLNLLAQDRQKIAKKCNSSGWNQFGLRRDREERMRTPLYSPSYENYGQRFSTFILFSLWTQEELGKTAIPYEENFDPIDGYSFSFTVNKINQQERELCLDKNYSNNLIFSSFIEFEGHKIPLSRYVLANQERSEIDKILPGTIVHQEGHLIQEMLDGPVMRMFTSAISWNREEGVESLVKTMALFRFFFAHAMPFARGSAAIGEWLEKAIYLYHGFIDFEHEKSRLADLEALTLPLSDYLKEYPKTITGVF